MKIWIMLAICIWWISNESRQICSFTPPDLHARSPPPPPQYPTVTFYTQNADDESYGAFISELRARLVSGSYIHRIPLLRDAAGLTDSQRYILVQIYDAAGRTFVTFAMDVTTAYIVAYRNANQRFFFNEAPPNAETLLFTDAETTPLPRTSSNYVDLERDSDLGDDTFGRLNISLGLGHLQVSIERLYSTTTALRYRARSLIVVFQMVSESVRYWYIETIMRRAIANGRPCEPDNYVISLENRWGRFSRRILQSPLFFANNVTLTSQHNTEIVVDSVNHEAVSSIAVLKQPCGKEKPSFKSHLKLRANHFATETCPLAEPKMRIRGRDGFCVDVKLFVYTDRNPIILFKCRESDFKNQLWTFRSDGRIESLEKCMAASGTTEGSEIVIHECETLIDDRVHWKMLDSGSIMNEKSGLVLTASSGESGTVLTLEKDSNSSSQSWLPTRTLQFTAVQIRGDNDICIYYNGRYNAYTEKCDQESARQVWILYPDGTIRPSEWNEGCLKLKYREANYELELDYYSKANELYRWMFTHHGTIMNLQTGLVVDASSEGYLYGWTFHGGKNQIWTLEFY